MVFLASVSIREAWSNGRFGTKPQGPRVGAWNFALFPLVAAAVEASGNSGIERKHVPLGEYYPYTKTSGQRHNILLR